MGLFLETPFFENGANALSQLLGACSVLLNNQQFIFCGDEKGQMGCSSACFWFKPANKSCRPMAPIDSI